MHRERRDAAFVPQSPGLISFGQHFGTTEIRQNIVRHTFVAGPETGGVEKIAHIDAQPAIPTPVIVENVAKSFFRCR